MPLSPDEMRAAEPKAVNKFRQLDTEIARRWLISRSQRTKMMFAHAISHRFPTLTARQALNRVPFWVEELIGTTLEKGCQIRVVAPGDAIPPATPQQETTLLAGYIRSSGHVRWNRSPEEAELYGDKLAQDIELHTGSLMSRFLLYAVPRKQHFYPNARHFWLCVE